MARSRGIDRRTAALRLGHLARRGKLRRLSRGIYADDAARTGQLEVTPAMSAVGAALHKELPVLDATISSTFQLASLMHNMPRREIVMVAVARKFVRDVVEALGAHNIAAHQARARADVAQLMAQPGDVAVVVLALGESRGTRRQGDLLVASPERLLADLLIERERIGLPIYEEDLLASAEGLLRGFPFSVSRFLDYAKRRNALSPAHQLIKTAAEAAGRPEYLDVLASR